MNTLQKALFSSISRNKNKNALWINNKYYTYKKLNDLSEKYRKVYSRSNSNLVCILLEKNIYCYACILAIVKDGRTYVPLNPKFPVEKNRKIFFTEMIRRKVFWQPYHHSYFCYRHSYDDIDYVLNCVNESLKAI